VGITDIHPYCHHRNQGCADNNRDVKNDFDLVAKKVHRSKLEGMLSVSM
jgi:hypothetical protein